MLGGIFSDVGSIFGGALDVAKIIAAVATGNTSAFTNAADKLVSTHAAGDLGKIMVGLPRTLVSDLAKSLLTSSAAKGGGGWGNVPILKNVSGAVALGQAMAASLGWTGPQWDALYALWTQESGWNPFAVNPTSGAYGIPQALPAVWGHPYPLGDAGPQIRWGLGYVENRYRTPVAAEAHELADHWYDQGGWLQPGMPGIPVNGLTRPEAVLTPEQSDALLAFARALPPGKSSGLAGPHTIVNVQQTYQGSIYPTAEQRAIMNRDLALAIGGGG
ncbi:MAG TPA: hypothetical protein VMV07_11350 [Streptosporangiaceae bacterium]|nr:hypothetical protein [Streptosporangiaceae bacterium]